MRYFRVFSASVAIHFSAHRRGGSFFLTAKRTKNCRLIFFYESQCSGAENAFQKIPMPVKSKTGKQWFGLRNWLRMVYYFTLFAVSSVFPWQFACFSDDMQNDEEYRKSVIANSSVVIV